MDKKQFDKELDLSKISAEVLKGRIDKIEELEKRITELEERFRRHVNNLDAHKE